MKTKLFSFFLGCLMSAGCGAGIQGMFEDNTPKSKVLSCLQRIEFSSLKEKEGSILLNLPNVYKRKF